MEYQSYTELQVDEHAKQTKIAELTTDIVAAYVSSHKLQVLDVSDLIKAVGAGLVTLGTSAEPTVPEAPPPAVSVRRSVRPDHLVCLVCGRKQKLLKRHLAVEHELTPNQYRETFGLKSDYPMAAPNYAQQRRELAVKLAWGGQTSGAGGSRLPAP
jgi:predicted transcriptional regulator